MSEVDLDAFNQNRAIYVSLNCSFWDGIAGICFYAGNVPRCPHCGSQLATGYANEQELFKSDLFKKYRSFYLFSRGKCFTSKDEADTEYRKAMRRFQRVVYDPRLFVYQLYMFDARFPRTVA